MPQPRTSPSSIDAKRSSPSGAASSIPAQKTFFAAILFRSALLTRVDELDALPLVVEAERLPAAVLALIFSGRAQHHL